MRRSGIFNDRLLELCFHTQSVPAYIGSFPFLHDYCEYTRLPITFLDTRTLAAGITRPEIHLAFFRIIYLRVDLTESESNFKSDPSMRRVILRNSASIKNPFIASVPWLADYLWISWFKIIKRFWWTLYFLRCHAVNFIQILSFTIA